MPSPAPQKEGSVLCQNIGFDLSEWKMFDMVGWDAEAQKPTLHHKKRSNQRRIHEIFDSTKREVCVDDYVSKLSNADFSWSCPIYQANTKRMWSRWLIQVVLRCSLFGKAPLLHLSLQNHCRTQESYKLHKNKSWWLSHPSEKTNRQLVDLPQYFAVWQVQKKIETTWNHHLVT